MPGRESMSYPKLVNSLRIKTLLGNQREKSELSPTNYSNNLMLVFIVKKKQQDFHCC